MAEALDKILRLAGAPMGADVGHNAAAMAVMKDASGTANHSTREGIVLHSVKNSDGAVVMSHHPSHSSAGAMKMTASDDGSPSDGLVMHGIMNKSSLGKGQSPMEMARMMAADSDGDNDAGHEGTKDAKKDLKEADEKLGGISGKDKHGKGDKK